MIKKLILLSASLMLALSTQAATLSYNSTAAANAGTNVLFTNAIVLQSVTFYNTGGTNFNFALFNSSVRSNQYAVPAYTNITYAIGNLTNTYTNILTGTTTNYVLTNGAIVATTNTDLATNRTYPIIVQSTVTTNTGAGVTFTLNTFFSHGLVMTNNQQAAGAVQATFQYLNAQ